MSAAAESLTARLVLDPAELMAVHACLPPGMRAGETPAGVDEPGPWMSGCWPGCGTEVQAQRDTDLSRRLYQYHHRIADRFGRGVVSLVLLADPGAVRLSVVAAGPAMVRRTSIAAPMRCWRG